MSNVVVKQENVHLSRIVANDRSVISDSLMDTKSFSRYQLFSRLNHGRNAAGRSALLFLSGVMLAVAPGCTTVKSAAVHSPKSGEIIAERSLSHELDQGPSNSSHAVGAPATDSAQLASEGLDPSVAFIPEPDFEGKYSDVIVRTRARLRVGPEPPLRDINSIRVPEVLSLRPPVVQALGDDLLPVRPPLRQLWLHHRTALPAGYEMELRLPHSAFLAPDERVSTGYFRNAYGGLGDQALLHPAPATLPAEDNRLPVIGPPPPHHAVKAFATFTGLALVGAGVYAFAPSSFVGGDKEGQWQDAWGHFKEAWTKPPVFDKDPASVNYLGHPYFGSLFYLTQRNYDESPLRSFLFSVFMSTCFEYFVESWSERPSINDLIVTPVVGSILGEVIYLATKEMRKDGFTTAEKIMVTVINPMYVFQNGYR